MSSYVCMATKLVTSVSDEAPTNPTALLLVDVAEELFALHGYNGTSVRDITSKAAVNLGAVTYHFGTKENLLKAILLRGASKLNDERMRRFDAIERLGAKPKVEEIVRAFIEPVYALLGTIHGVRFLRIQNDISAERTDVPREVLAEHYDPCARHCIRLLASAAPHIDAESLLWNFQFILGALLYSITQSKRFPELRVHGNNHEREVNELTRFVSAAFRSGHSIRERT
jgi:AcrR family transcriptional regulator